MAAAAGAGAAVRRLAARAPARARADRARRGASRGGCSGRVPVITLFFVVLALFAPLIAPYGFDQYQAGGKRFAQLGPRPRRI